MKGSLLPFSRIITGYPAASAVYIANMNFLLPSKRDHWRYEDEWRLIVELDDAIGNGPTDKYGQSFNLRRVPNEAIKHV